MSHAATIRGWFRGRARHWLARQVPAARRCSLHRRNIFILPTRQGMGFLGVALLVFLTAINYGISLAFGLAFLMVALFLVSILHTFRNLQGLTLEALDAAEVFAGETSVLRVALKPRPGRSHEALEFAFDGHREVGVRDIRVAADTVVGVPLPVSRRGRVRAPRLRVSSSFPLGLCVAWSLPDLEHQCLVYPAPRPCQWRGALAGQPEQAGQRDGEGDDDFRGLQEYRAGDPINRIAWKNYARTGELQIKQFQAAGGSRLMLSWYRFEGFPAEQRLEMLCHLVLQSMQQGQACGLEMPGLLIEPGRGPEHRRRLLETLALGPSG